MARTDDFDRQMRPMRRYLQHRWERVAAEREFLERVPLPDDVRPWLWLDDVAMTA